MLELNKEYTYKEICNELGWKVSDGNSKKAQIREIESAFKFFHPENKKTHKPKKSYIFTEMLRELQKPSVKNNGGCHNDKNISPMMEYLRAIFSDERLHEQPFTMTNLFCNVLKLMRKSCYEKGYAEDDELLNYCQRNYIYNPNLFKAYSATIKKVLKEITLNAITALGREKSCEYEDGYIFYYKMAKSDDRIIGNIFSDYINDEVIEVERKICEEFNEKHNLSSKMKGRQLLMKIYASKALREQFDREKCAELMKHEDAIRDLNGVIEETYQFTGQYIESSIPADATGYVLNLDNGDFKYASCNMDYNSIKLLLDNLKQMLNDIACIPSVLGSSTNVANISEVAMKILFAMAEVNANECKKWLNTGFKQRFKTFQKILNMQGISVGCDVDVVYNVAMPVAGSEMIANLKALQEMGAVSVDTIMEKVDLVSDPEVEKVRLQNEKSVVNPSDAVEIE